MNKITKTYLVEKIVKLDDEWKRSVLHSLTKKQLINILRDIRNYGR